MSDLFQPTSRKKEVPFRGRLSSRDWNDFQDGVVADLAKAATIINDLSNRYDLKILELEEERKKLGAAVEHFKTAKLLDDAQKAVLGETIRYHQTFRLLDDIDWTSVTDANSLKVEPAYGQAMLPWNRCISRFGSMNPTTNQVTVPSTIEITATAVNEGTGDVITGTPRLAVDSMSAEPWVRKVLFGMEDDQKEVTMDVDISIPTLFAANANMITIVPSPAGEVDIVNITYSTTTAAPSTQIPGFAEARDVSSYRIHFGDLAITKLRIRLRQRHFTFEQAEKVFIYGLKEVGVYLVEFEKAAVGTAIVQFAVDAPSGYKFNDLTGFVSTPNYATIGDDTHIRFKIFTEAARTTELWDSYNDTALSVGSPLNVSGNAATTLYIAMYLDYDTTNEVSPVVNSFYMDYTVTSV